MEKLNEFLQTLLSTCSYELNLEPNRMPYLVSENGVTDVANAPLLGTQISMLIFPLIPNEVKQDLPNKNEVQFVHNHNLGNFNFHVRKSPAGFNVTIRPMLSDNSEAPGFVQNATEDVLDVTGRLISPDTMSEAAKSESYAPPVAAFTNLASLDNMSSTNETPNFSAPQSAKVQTSYAADDFDDLQLEVETPLENKPKYQAEISGDSNYRQPAKMPEIAFDFSAEVQSPAAQPEKIQKADASPQVAENPAMRRRMDALFHQMAEAGASDLHMSVSLPPMIRKDGKMQKLGGSEQALTPDVMKNLLESIMPVKNREEFARRRDTDFAYEIENLARFRANIFMDRKGMGAVFRIIPSKILTAEELGLSKAITDLCDLSKGLVVVTGPTGSGKSTTLCAMVDGINKRREDHIITIEDPIEFTHENQKCLVNQREVHNHTESFKDALRAALREDPDIVLVGEMRDLETIAIAIETAETGHLVFGTLHTTTAASTIDRIIDQFPADRQQQIRVMLSESLKGVIAQTLLPKKGGGRIAALEVLIVTPAISNLIREGKTFQIPSAMQTGKTQGMVMLNDALFDLVKKGLVEPRDAYIKAVDKTGFESQLTRNGFHL